MTHKETTAMHDDDISDRYHNARDERLESLVLRMLAEPPSERARASAIKSMIARAGREAFELIAVAEAAASGVHLAAREPEVFDFWEREQPNGAH